MPFGFSVLVASADADVLDMFARRLVVLGCQATTVTGYREAFDLVRSRDFHLVFLTEELDGGDGATLATDLRRLFPQLELTLLTRLGGRSASTSAVRRVLCPADWPSTDTLIENSIEEACLGPRISANQVRPATVG